MVKRRSICDYKIREIMPVLGAIVLVANFVGYIGGFILVDFNVKGTRRMIKPEMQHGQTIQRQTWHEQQLQTVTPRTVGSETMHASSAGQVSHHLDPAGSTVTVRFAEQPSSRQSEVVTQTVSHRNQAVSISSDLPARRSETSVVQSWEPCRPSKGRTATDGRWYNFSTPTFRFYAYSAWLDDRESILTDPVIRIISITTKLAEDDPGSQQSKGSSDVQLFCALTYDTGIRYVSMEPKPRPIGYGWPLNEEWVREYVYTCPIVDKLTPSSVSIVANAGDSVGSCMPVEISKKATPKKDFAVCALVASGNMDAYRVIEWMELHRLLGVTTVTVYTLDVDAQTVNVFRHYATEAFVDLRRTDYIESGSQQHFLHGTPVANDCMYRNMHRFNHVIVVDFDEVILPRLDTTYRKLIDRLQKVYSSRTDPPIHYTFQNAYFYTDLPPDTSESPYLTFLRYRTRAPLNSPYGYAVKSIIDTRACVGLHNHYCWSVTTGYARRGQPEVVDTAIAVNQNYKKCGLEREKCEHMFANATSDDSIFRYRRRLKRNAEEKILSILGHNI